MGMTPDEFYNITFAEYQYKIQGFQKQRLETIWLSALMNAKAQWNDEKHPYPTLEEFMKPQKSPPEPTDEEIFDLAKEKGIDVPEGK